MPKTLILLLTDDAALAARARRVADGARAVRFAEVDVRSASTTSAHAALLTAADYDAVVVGVAAPGENAADDPAALAAAALATFDPGRALADTVGAALAPDDAAAWAVLRALAAHGLLLVPSAAAPAERPPDDADRQLGRRVATVAGWVRHARGHEHGHEHGHAHDHQHTHPHPHAHPH
jgi:hypothetical protein